jgi:hypothetical protein
VGSGKAGGGIGLTPLWLPYIFNNLVLVPIWSPTLLGGKTGGQLACQGKFPESAWFRPIRRDLAVPATNGDS